MRNRLAISVSGRLSKTLRTICSSRFVRSGVREISSQAWSVSSDAPRSLRRESRWLFMCGVFGEWRGPFHGGADMGEFDGDVGQDAGADFETFAQYAQSVLAHFLAGEELGERIREVQTSLNLSAGEGNAEVGVGEEQAAIATGKGTARIQKPGARASGIHVRQLEELCLEMPGEQ